MNHESESGVRRLSTVTTDDRGSEEELWNDPPLPEVGVVLSCCESGDGMLVAAGGEHVDIGESDLEAEIRPPQVPPAAPPLQDSCEDMPFSGCGKRCENWDSPGNPANPPSGGNKKGFAAAGEKPR